MVVVLCPCSDAPTFAIDKTDLEKRYKNLQRSLHPDRFSAASEKEKEISAVQASTVNHAYSLLREPLTRANCIVRS